MPPTVLVVSGDLNLVTKTGACPRLAYSFQLLDHLEIILADGGKVVDYHSCELFPERCVLPFARSFLPLPWLFSSHVVSWSSKISCVMILLL
jgi:hypothetical protein